jgi:SAM-dependent methyltransferase
MPATAHKDTSQRARRRDRPDKPEPRAKFELSPQAVRYAIAIFLSSTLLFFIQPIAGKRLLPLLGGSAAVWTACLVFFQCALLLGYFVAHLLVTRTSPRTQVALYVSMLALSLAQLGFAITPELTARSDRPILSVLWLLTLLIGVPFVTMSATSPLLQAWFARSSATGANAAGGNAQAYRLFSISNVGSMLSLLIYPWLIEPNLSLRGQTITLSIGFVALMAICITIALSVRNLPPAQTVEQQSADAKTDITLQQRGLWIGLAAAGSLLLSAVTTHISQNVVTLPLLWIVPLVAYLLSFVVAFGSDHWPPRWLVIDLALVGLLWSAYMVYTGILDIPIVRAAGIFCLSLFLLCLFLHSELYRRRPAARELTSFYFHVAAGGALGAVIAGIVAPSVLTGSYELAVGLCLTAAIGLAAVWPDGPVIRGVWSTIFVGLIALIAVQVRKDRLNDIMRERNFYGTAHVIEVVEPELAAPVRTMLHGAITHGREVFREDLHGKPGSYYAPGSGIALALANCCDQRPRRIGVIGLGTGTQAAFGQPGDTIRFYEINPAIEVMARAKFTYLRETKAVVDVVIGDARVSLASEPPQRYDLIAIDAFSGDAIPVHLITAQAIEVYKRHLVPGGVIAFHVSNRYLDLPPVVDQVARNAGMKAALISGPDDYLRDYWKSDWVLVSANDAFLAKPAIASARREITVPARLRLWTDDYNSLLPVIQVKQRGF